MKNKKDDIIQNLLMAASLVLSFIVLIRSIKELKEDA